MWVITLRKGHLCWDAILRTGKVRFAGCQKWNLGTCCHQGVGEQSGGICFA